MVMAMDRTCIRAITAHGELASKRRLSGAGGVSPSSVAAEGADRRPVRHRRRRDAFVVVCKLAGAIDDFSTHDGQIGGRISDLVFPAGEVVTVGHDDVPEVASLDAPFPS